MQNKLSRKKCFKKYKVVIGLRRSYLEMPRLPVAKYWMKKFMSKSYYFKIAILPSFDFFQFIPHI